MAIYKNSVQIESTGPLTIINNLFMIPKKSLPSCSFYFSIVLRFVRNLTIELPKLL